MQSAEAQVAAASQADATREDVVLVLVDVGAEETQIGNIFILQKQQKRKLQLSDFKPCSTIRWTTL